MNKNHPLLEFMVDGIHDDTLHVDLYYPGMPDTPTFIQIGLMHPRAADDLKISYDFQRNGWKIEQLDMHDQDVEDEADPEWKETAFLPVYPFEKEANRAK